MVNNEYTADAVMEETFWSSDEEVYDQQVWEPHPEDWMSWYSDDLWNMYHLITRYAEENGISRTVNVHMTFAEFCHFCYSMSRHGLGPAN